MIPSVDTPQWPGSLDPFSPTSSFCVGLGTCTQGTKELRNHVSPGAPKNPEMLNPETNSNIN